MNRHLTHAPAPLRKSDPTQPSMTLGSDGRFAWNLGG